MPEALKLSICIATYKRAKFIAQTLDSTLSELQPGVEVVVVDGASPDDTPGIMAKYLARSPKIRYFRESRNSGVDQDYDKAVGYARGEYCWLMTDDDLLIPGSVKRLLESLKKRPNLVVVNAEVRNANLSRTLQTKRWSITEDRFYGRGQAAEFFREAGDYLSFIGAVVMRRDLWLSRDRSSYFGSLFVHFGVIFQHEPIEDVIAIAEPLVAIRYGNAMWTSRAFEIWMFKWPRLVWSFDHFSEADKQRVCALEPWRCKHQLRFLRATGAYSFQRFRAFLSGRLHGRDWRFALWMAIYPRSLAHLKEIEHALGEPKTAPITWYELLRSSPAAGRSHRIVQQSRPEEYELWAAAQ